MLLPAPARIPSSSASWRAIVIGASALALFLSSLWPSPVAQSTGLVAAYGFNENTGTTTADLSGNNLTGTIVGATWTSGRYGNALSFNGSTSYVDLGNPAVLQLTGSMTLEAWVKATANPGDDGQIIAKSNGAGWQFKTSPDTGPHTFGVLVSASGSSHTQRYSTTVRSLDTWYHVAAVYDNAARTLSTYVNGVLDNGTLAGTVPASQLNQNVNVNIGRRSGGYYFSGVIDEVRIYNRALSQAAIQTDMNTPVGGSPPPVDATPPTVSMSAPADGATVAGTTSVTALAADNVGVAGVQFLLDGVNLGSEVTAAPFTLQWNTAGASLGAHTLTAVARDFSNLTTTSEPVSVMVTNPSGAQTGGWSSVMNWPIVAVHASLLPSGNVLAWTDYTENGGAQLWRPATNTFTPMTYSLVSLFCSGHVFLADGRLFVVGGIVGLADDVGPYDSTIFNSSTETWSQGAFMSAGRYYPTATTLGDGRVLVQGGTTTCTSCVADTPEVYDPVADAWTSLASSARKAFQYYPHPYLLPDGRVIVVAQDDRAISTQVLNLGTHTWTTVDARVLDGHSSAMYLPGKIMKAGTATADNPGHPTAATTYVLDMAQPSPAWQATSPMAFPRSFLNLTVLPDGQVLATGGSRTTDPASVPDAVYEAELWSPTTRTWTTLARMEKPRLYHSTALLLPDARVLVAGGGRQNGRSQPDPKDQENAEIFSPPYLFKGPRPVISSAPAVLPYNASFAVATPDASRIASVSLIALGSVTHAFNQNQRFVPLAFTDAGTSLNVTGPINGNTAPPGPYMLFIVDSTGVPSVAAMVRLPAPNEDAEPPSAPANLTATTSVGSVSLTWAASTDNSSVSGYDVHRSTSPGFTPTFANRIGQTSTTTYTDTSLSSPGTYFYRVTARDSRGNVSGPSNEASASVALDVTAPTVSITAPAAGATVSATVSVQASASDDVGVAGVQFFLDGAPLGPEVNGAGPTYTYSWSTTATANGPHTLSARARDGAGNTATTGNVNVTVSNAVPTGLVAAYSFDDATGTTVADLSGNTNTGSISGATWTTGGRFGSALSFNGTSSRVTVPDSASLDLTNALTLEAWVRPSVTPTSWRAVMHKDVDRYYLFASGTQNRPVVGGTFGTTNQNVTAPTALSVGTWAHLAATYDRTTIRLYVNGVQVATGPQTAAVSTSNAVLTIGADFYGEQFAGLIDEVRVYNRALTAAEIQSDMNTAVAPRLVIGQPLAGSTVDGSTIAVTYSGTGNLAVVDHVHFTLDTRPEVMDRDFDGSYQFLDVPAGAHLLSGHLVRADHSKIQGTDASVAFSTAISDSTPPAVAIASPQAGAAVSSVVAVSVSASDNVGIAGVQLLLDDVTLGPEMSGPGPNYTYSWNTAATTNGPHTLSARARDAAGNIATAANVAITVANDTTPPTVSVTSPVAGSSLNGVVAVVASASDNETLAGVQFVLDGANLGGEVTGTGPTFTYTWNTTTAANGTHTLSARARDTSGNTAAAANVTVSVSNDTMPPSVSLTSPAGGATVTGPVNVVATASDNAALAGVQFLLDGVDLGAEVAGAGPTFSYSWDTTTAPDGAHTLSARARDTAGNTAPAANVSVAVSNDATPPTVSLTAPAADATVTGMITIVASAADNVALAGVQFLIDGNNLGAEVTGAGPTFSFTWNTMSATNGTHTLSARARDRAGNTAPAGDVTVSVANDTTSPTVSVTSPAAEATVTGPVNVEATASDNVAVAGVQFLLDGANLGAEVTGAGPAFTYNWNTTSAPNGSHTLSARARDAAGNTAPATNVVFTVFNDTTPPTVSLTSPAAGATGTGSIDLVASASDNGALAGVQFLLDGSNLGPEVTGTGPTFTYRWNTTAASDGSHTLSARARDVAGNIGPAPNVAITVLNDTTPPAVSLTSPAGGATITGSVSIVASASDNRTLAGVQFLLDGNNLGAEITGSGPSFTYTWNTLTATNGAHTLSARARDASGNTAPAANVAVTVANNGLKAAYSFNAGSGTTAVDSSGSGITGTLSGATWTTAGKYGSALSFNGNNGYVNLGNPAALATTGSMTWTAWVYAAANPSDDGQIVARSTGNNGWQLKTSPDTGPHTFAIGVAGSGGLTQRYSRTTRALNTWYHVAGVYNTATATLDIYVNGLLDNGVLRGTIPATRTGPNTNVNIGRRSGGYYFRGVIDEVRIYDRALSQTEIQSLMTAPLP